MPKKIFIHDTIVNPIGQRGVMRCYNAYTEALIRAYPGQVSIYSASPPKIGGATVIPSLSTKVKPRIIRKRIAHFDNRFGAFIADSSSHIYYSPFYGNMYTKIPQVFTAYDMIYEKFPLYFPLSERPIRKHIEEKRACFERATLILCISKNTANDILDMYPKISSSKLKIVYIGVDDLFFQESPSKNKDKPYFLFVGNRSFYKNFTRFLMAFGKSGLAKDFDLRVVSPVDMQFTSAELNIIREYDLKDHIQSGVSVSDLALHEQYGHAFAFVYPTEYEGFGLPLLEAMASGTLVLASNLSSLPEIGGDVPLYFEASSIDSMIETLKVASQMPEAQRQERILRGKTRALQFTWQTSATSFLHALQTILC